MKKTATVLSIISGTLMALLGLVFTVIEFRLLWSRDFLAYSNPIGGFFNILFKLLTALFVVAIGIFPYFHLGKKENRERIITNGLLSLLLLFIMVILQFVFATTGYEFYIYLGGLALAVIYIVSQFIVFLKTILLKEPIDEKVSNS